MPDDDRALLLHDSEATRSVAASPPRRSRRFPNALAEDGNDGEEAEDMDQNDEDKLAAPSDDDDGHYPDDYDPLDDDADQVDDGGYEGLDSDDEEDQDAGPSARGRDEFVAFCNDNTFFAPLARAEVTGIHLMEVLRQKKAPINAYPSLMDWHLREKGTIVGQQTLKDAGPAHFIGRKTLLARLARRYNLQDKGPVERVVKLPSSKEVVKIPIFDAEDKVVELLTNPRLMPEDVDLFDEDPLAPPPMNLDYVGNLNTGSGFSSTYEALIDKANQQLLGTPFYIDGAVTGQFSDLPVTAVKFSLTTFTRQARMKPHMWATLGYLPEIKVAESRGKKIFKESQHLEAEDMDIFEGEGEDVDVEPGDSDDEDELTEIKPQDFHFMLSVILASYKRLQRRGMIWDMVFNSKVWPGIHYKFYIPIVRCDTEEADQLCGKYKPRTRNIKQLCRQCEVPTLKADDHLANYRPKTQSRIQRLVRNGKLDRLQEMSQHFLRNAWHDLRFQLGNDHGIHGACPSEMLHQMQLGIFKYCRDIFFLELGESAQVAKEVNGLARMYGKLLSHQSDRTLPATNFSQGIRGGKLMAKDYRGVLLIMAVVMRSSEGRKLMGTKRKFKQEYKKDDWLLLVELLLEWEACLCQPTMKKKHVKRLDKKHRYIMYIMKKVAKRTKGMGLNVMKFHAIIHLMTDIVIHGVPLEFDTAANESHHKEAKVAARMTQRNETNFNMQVATRMWEFHILDLALEEIKTGHRVSDYFTVETDESGSEMSTSPQNTDENGSNPDHNAPVVTTDDAKIAVFRDDEDAPCFEMLTKSKYAGKTSMNIDLLEFLLDLQDKILEHSPAHELSIFTRHKRDGVTFHGHPNYRGQGPWKDWVMVNWVGYGRLPCHINCFVDLQGIPGGASIQYGGVVLKNCVYAVVESATVEDDDEEVKKADLLVPYLKEVKGLDLDGGVTGRQFYLAETEAFVKPCAVVPDIGGACNRYFLVKSRDDWHKEFIAWVEDTYEMDDMTEEDDDD